MRYYEFDLFPESGYRIHLEAILLKIIEVKKWKNQARLLKIRGE